MGRWEPNTRERLRHAALELFLERGYESTTAAEIAERAGMAKSTFFRHYTDKREVLFDGNDVLSHRCIEAINAAPADATVFDILHAGLGAIAPMFEPHQRAWQRQRSTVITRNHELRERDLLKREALTAAVTDALKQRGLPTVTAGLAAELAHLALRTAFARWLESDTDQELGHLMSEALQELRTALPTFE